MVWITFFLTLLSGAITALIGVHTQHWYSKKKTQERMIKALREEIRTNIKRLDYSIQSLQKKEKTDRELTPYLTVCYETFITQAPELYYELSSRTNYLVDEAYADLQMLNRLYTLVNLAVSFTDEIPEPEIKFLKEVKEKLENVLSDLEKL